MQRYNPPLLGVDISKWQRVVGADYEYPVFCARVHSGYSIDANFAANARVIDSIPGVKVKVAYVVPVAGMDVAEVVGEVMSVLPAGWCVMIDEESGPGFHGPGDHSDINNAMREQFIGRGLGRRMVWGYANGGDWASGWPRRGDTPMVVAKYSASDNDLIRSDQCIGWQYSDGDGQWGVPDGYPRGSRAVGSCDMNVYGFPSGDAFAAWLGGGHTTTGGNAVSIEEDPFMALTEQQQDDLYNDVQWIKNRLGNIVPGAEAGRAPFYLRGPNNTTIPVWRAKDGSLPVGAQKNRVADTIDMRTVIERLSTGGEVNTAEILAALDVPADTPAVAPAAS